MAGGTRPWWLFRDAMCEAVAAAVTIICEGVTIGTSRPVGANFM